MMDTKLLLQKIAALRMRLDADAAQASTVALHDPTHAVEQKVQQGAVHNRLIESALKSAETPEAAPAQTPLRLSARGARLLRKGREALHSLRGVADDPMFQGDSLEQMHREGVAMTEVVLRTVQAFPGSMSEQLRLCDGLEVILGEVSERIAQLDAGLRERRHVETRIDELAEILRWLASEKP